MSLKKLLLFILKPIRSVAKKKKLLRAGPSEVRIHACARDSSAKANAACMAHSASHKKRAGRGVDHFFPSAAEVKNEWSSASTPLICLHGVDRDNISSIFTML
jgi:hypothetical protein